MMSKPDINTYLEDYCVPAVAEVSSFTDEEWDRLCPSDRASRFRPGDHIILTDIRGHSRELKLNRNLYYVPIDSVI